MVSLGRKRGGELLQPSTMMFKTANGRLIINVCVLSRCQLAVKMVAMFGVWGSSEEHPAGHLVISYSNFRFGLRMPVNLLTVP